MAETLLEIDGIETCYGLSQVLFGLSLKVQSGEMVALMGRNGMGKTTTIRSIMGMTGARAGTIRFAGEEVRRLPSYKIAKLGIGLVPEGRQIFPNLTVEEHLSAFQRRPEGDAAAAGEPWDAARVFALFPRLAERRRHLGHQLSGGEQQMLAIGRALMTNPDLLLMDEPTEGLAPLIVREVGRVIAELKREGLSILLVEQNLPLALSVADTVHVLSRGQIVHSGTPAGLMASEDVKSRYLGV